MKPALAIWLILAASTPLAAQWLNHPTPGIPRTPDGKPNLTAPAPQTADGHPDLSGTWSIDGLGYAYDIVGASGTEMRPWAQTLYKQRAENYWKDDTDIHCLPPGPRAGLFGENLLKIVQTPLLAVILYEQAPPRQIFLDGRDLPRDPNPTWMGYSVGHWESDTLVVQTTGFNDRTWLDFTGHPHTEALQVTERFRRTDFGHMRLEITLDDDKAYTKPWTISVNVNFAADTELLEFVCNENEKDRGHLTGSIADEKRREIVVSRDTLSRYVGTYHSDAFGDFQVTAEQGELRIQLPGGGGLQPLFAQSETEFVFPIIGGIVTFIPGAQGAQGSTMRLLIKIVEGDQEAVRIASPEDLKAPGSPAVR